MYACGFRPTNSIGKDGSSRKAGKLGPTARVPAKSRFQRDEDGNLNQNPNFEKASKTTNKKGVWYYDKS